MILFPKGYLGSNPSLGVFLFLSKSEQVTHKKYLQKEIRKESKRRRKKLIIYSQCGHIGLTNLTKPPRTRSAPIKIPQETKLQSVFRITSTPKTRSFPAWHLVHIP